MEFNAKKLISEINEGLTQKGQSKKDERDVMHAMINDPTFKTAEYNNTGEVVRECCPHDNAVQLAASIINKGASIPSAEAQELANNMQFTKTDASNLVDISKEFMLGYLDTGRKISLGCKADSDISFMLKETEEKVAYFPKKNEDGTYDKGESITPAHKGVKASSPCPKHLKNKK